jgi:ABC-type branched-subunit amino acid transport system ATPase component
MAEEMLSLAGVSSWYGAAQALFDVTLQVEPGEVVGLLGRNGAGKSSTFNSIMNVQVRRTGDIRAAGRNLRRLKTDAIARLGVGWVPEDRRIFPNLTVAENLELARFALDDRAPVGVEELVEAFPLLGSLLKRKGGQLSGGEQQVVAVARALSARPRILLLDEPTEGLAPLVVEQLAQSIAALPREFGVSVLLAEQNLEFVLGLSTRVYVLEMGRVVHHGPTAEVASDRQLQERFLSVSAAR